MEAKELSPKLMMKLRELAEKPDGWGDIRVIESADARAILAALPSDAKQARTDYATGVEAVAKMLDRKADDYAREFGRDDKGSLSFGQGAHADAKRDYHWSLIELAEEVRAMNHTAPVGSVAVPPIRHEITALASSYAGVSNEA